MAATTLNLIHRVSGLTTEMKDIEVSLKPLGKLGKLIFRQAKAGMSACVFKVGNAKDSASLSLVRSAGFTVRAVPHEVDQVIITWNHHMAGPTS